MERVTSSVFADYIADNILTLDPCKTEKGTGWADRYTHQVRAERYYNQSETIYEIAKE